MPFVVCWGLNMARARPVEAIRRAQAILDQMALAEQQGKGAYSLQEEDGSSTMSKSGYVRHAPSHKLNTFVGAVDAPMVRKKMAHFCNPSLNLMPPPFMQILQAKATINAAQQAGLV